MTEEFETAGLCTGTWWSFPNGMFSDCSLQRSPEIPMDFEGFEWQNNDTLAAKTYHKSHTSTLLRNTNLDYTSQINAWNHYNHCEEERFDSINSFLEELFDSSEQLVEIKGPNKFSIPLSPTPSPARNLQKQKEKSVSFFSRESLKTIVIRKSYDASHRGKGIRDHYIRSHR